MRKAVDALVDENLLVRRQGKGTFVATHAEQRVQFRFLRLKADDGQEGGITRRFIDCRRLRAPAEIARALNLRAGDSTVQIRRLLSFRGRPVVLDDIWLPGHAFRGLNAERLAEYRGPIYGLFESEFGVRMVRAEERLRAVAADAEASRWLAVPVASPLLEVLGRFNFRKVETIPNFNGLPSFCARRSFANTLTRSSNCRYRSACSVCSNSSLPGDYRCLGRIYWQKSGTESFGKRNLKGIL